MQVFVWTCPADDLPRRNARMRRDTLDDTLTTGRRKKRVQTVLNDGLFADDLIHLLVAQAVETTYFGYLSFSTCG